MKSALVILLMGFALHSPAQAEDCQQATMADAAGYKIAVAKRKTHFRDDNGEVTPAYILPGDEVVVVSLQGAMACAEYSTSQQASLGLLPLADLGPLRKQSPAAADWLGVFRRDSLGSNVEIKKKRGYGLSVVANAYWAASDELAKKWGPNVGDVSGSAKIIEGILHVGLPEPSEPDCSLDLKLLSKRYMLVAKHAGEDGSLSCWGHNVSFDGLYAKVKQ